MPKKKRSNIIYSTNPHFNYEEEDVADESVASSGQTLYVHFEKKHRAGKKVTLIERFVGSDMDLKELAATLKKRCGVGGTAKDGVAIIQGDHCDKIKQLLLEMGYKVKG